MSDGASKQMLDSSAVDGLTRLRRLGEENATPEQMCSALAKLFRVKPDEVALLKLEKGVLRFLFPPGLKTAGTIPITGSAVAARTAATRSNLLSNTFAKIKHTRIFEEVKSGIARAEAPDRMPIQKLMSVPVLDQNREVRGVIQISRKGFDLGSAGPDFSSEDLKLLEQAASAVAAMKFMQ